VKVVFTDINQHSKEVDQALASVEMTADTLKYMNNDIAAVKKVSLETIQRRFGVTIFNNYKTQVFHVAGLSKSSVQMAINSIKERMSSFVVVFA